MVKKIAFGFLCLGFIIYAFFLAPPEQPGTFELIKNLSTGQWQGVNPLVIALFNLMSIWPLIYRRLPNATKILLPYRDSACHCNSSVSPVVGCFISIRYLAISLFCIPSIT